MKVFQIPVTPFGMNSYIYFDENTKEGVIFDPAAYGSEQEDEIKKVIEDNGIKIKYIINTHGHIDHIMGNKFAKDYFKVPILMHEKDMPFYTGVVEQGNKYGLVITKPPPVDEFINESSKIQFADVDFKILHTPGHSPGSLVFIDHKNKNIFSGDVIFKDSIGRTDLQFGNTEELINSINNILFPEVQDDYTIHPGHMEITTVGREKKFNPFL